MDKKLIKKRVEEIKTINNEIKIIVNLSGEIRTQEDFMNPYQKTYHISFQLAKEEGLRSLKKRISQWIEEKESQNQIPYDFTAIIQDGNIVVLKGVGNSQYRKPLSSTIYDMINNEYYQLPPSFWK